jgi:VWFA-related protein
MLGPAVAALLLLPAPGPAAQAPPPVFPSGVGLVEVPVIVSDPQGRFVPDLTRADFEISERGVPQAITAFERVSIPLPPAAPAGLAPPTPADVATNEGLADGRIFVLVLDALHVSPASVLAVRRGARRFVEENMGPADLAAVLSPGAAGDASQDFTSDKARLLGAIEGFTGTKLRSATLELEEERQLAGPGGTLVHGGRDPSDEERSYRAQSLYSVLEGLAGPLARVERRRKALLLFSEGVDYNLADLMGAVQRNASAVRQATERAVRALMRADVSVYAIDPRGLDSALSTTERLPPHDSPNAPRADGSIPRMDFSEPSLEDEHEASLTSLRTIAESTGGFAAVDRNEVGPAFARIVREASDYYVIGYAPARPAKAGTFQPIRVRVRRTGLRVVARSGYVVPSAEPPRAAAIEPQPAESAMRSPFAFRRPGNVEPQRLEARPAAPPKGLANELAALLSSSMPLAGLPLRVQATPFRGGPKKQVVQVVIEIPGSSVSFAERGGRFESRLEIASFTVDSSGHGANGRSTSIDMRLTPDELQRVRVTGVRWISPLELPPGRHRLRVAAREPATGAAGVVTTDVDVPSFAGEPSLSGVLLTSLPSVLAITRGETRLASALGTPPTVERRFVAGDQVVAAAEAYGPASGAGALLAIAEVERADGGVVLERRVEPPAGSGRPGLTEVSLPIDTASISPGRYVLRLRLDGAPAGGEGERSVPFEVVAPPVR